MNKVFIIGEVVKNPVVKSTTNGYTLCNYTLKVVTRGRDKQEKTTLIPVTMWEAGARFAQNYLRVGAKVFLEGSIKSSEYTNKNGEKMTYLNVTGAKVEVVKFSNSNKQGNYVRKEWAEETQVNNDKKPTNHEQKYDSASDNTRDHYDIKMDKVEDLF